MYLVSHKHKVDRYWTLILHNHTENCVFSLVIKMDRNKDNTRFCPHCSQELKASTFYTHRQKFFNQDTRKWKTEKQVRHEKFGLASRKFSSSPKQSKYNFLKLQAFQHGCDKYTKLNDDRSVCRAYLIISLIL